jgi:hypothetical protein
MKIYNERAVYVTSGEIEAGQFVAAFSDANNPPRLGDVIRGARHGCDVWGIVTEVDDVTHVVASITSAQDIQAMMNYAIMFD